MEKLLLHTEDPLEQLVSKGVYVIPMDRLEAIKRLFDDYVDEENKK